MNIAATGSFHDEEVPLTQNLESSIIVQSNEVKLLPYGGDFIHAF